MKLQSHPHPVGRVFLLLTGIAGMFGTFACGSGGGGGGSTAGRPGQELTKPDGSGTYFVDPNRGGSSTRVHLAEMFWARLVDVHDIDEQGNVGIQPVFRDFTINENIQSDGSNYRLETNPITQKTRLVILRRLGQPEPGPGLRTFGELLREAADGLPPIDPRNDNGTASDLSFAARNGVLVMRFDDLLDDDLQAQQDLQETVKVLAGYPPTTPFPCRQIFDPNHGGVVGGRFHSTRILIDLTVTETERLTMPVPQPPNSVGLPPSRTDTLNPNVSIRIPTQVDPGTGQFRLLRNLAGSPLAPFENGPVDLTRATRPVVRAMRSGNETDRNNGFLLDLNAPRVVGSWPLTVDSAIPDDQGQAGFDFLIDITFTTVCRIAPGQGDVISLGEQFLEIRSQQAPPDVNGRVLNVQARSLSDAPLPPGTGLVGNAEFLSTFLPADPVPRGCWVSFLPLPDQLPSTSVSTESRVIARFSEPMDPTTLTPLDNFFIVAGDASTQVNPTNLIVGDVTASADLKEFVFDPVLDLPHTLGGTEGYTVRLVGPTDLAGNELADGLGAVAFSMNPSEQTVLSGGTVLRFTSTDELEPIGFPDLRGQFFYNFEGGFIRPRPVTFSSFPADRVNPVPSIMVPFAPGVQTPLSPLGSKLHTVWRYCDLGWQILDETKFNMDVFGLSWAPIGGQVINDFYENFEIRLAHSRRQPDEAIDSNLLPRYVNSGLVGRGSEFSANVLNDPLSPQKVVHVRTLGYQITAADLFTASSGTVMMPFPLNRGATAPETFTWRDTGALGLGGPGGRGIPLDIEVGAPLQLEPAVGYVADQNEVPTFGLPLLMEFRCYPSDLGIGLNAVDISLAINSSPRPSFRSYSTGGFDRRGQAVQKNPDTEDSPTGGFNPGATVPGSTTSRADDNGFYIGQLEAVTRISRVHTVWIDSSLPSPDWGDPVFLPPQSEQPTGTQVVVEFRGAHSFTLGDLDAALSQVVDESLFPFDADRLDPYGDVFAILPPDPGFRHKLGSALFPGGIDYVTGDQNWVSDINAMDTAQYIQMRITFVSNIQTGLSPILAGIGLTYSE